MPVYSILFQLQCLCYPHHATHTADGQLGHHTCSPHLQESLACGDAPDSLHAAMNRLGRADCAHTKGVGRRGRNKPLRTLVRSGSRLNGMRACATGRSGRLQSAVWWRVGGWGWRTAQVPPAQADCRRDERGGKISQLDFGVRGDERPRRVLPYQNCGTVMLL